MKIFCFFIISVFSAIGRVSPVAAQQITIMSYNIHHGADASEHPTLDSIAAMIADSEVNIVGLQEVDSVCLRSNGVDQTEVLGNLTAMDHYFTRHFAYQGGAYGQGLLSDVPLTNLRNFRLPVFPLEDGKEVSVLVADIHPAPDWVFTVGVVHLDYKSAESRMHQIDILLDSLAGIQDLVLLGDFNAYPDSPEMLKLSQYFDRFQSTNEPPTFPAINPDRRIDFIWVKKGSKLRIVREYIPHVPYSDHLPLITSVRKSK